MGVSTWQLSLAYYFAARVWRRCQGGREGEGGERGGGAGACALHAGETAVPPSEPAGAATAQLRVSERLDVLAACFFVWCHAGGGGEVLA